MPFHLYALLGVAVVGVAVIVAYEVADWHRREQERELEAWHAQRRDSRSEKARGSASAREKRGLGEGTVRIRSNKRTHTLLSDTDPFRLTDSELEVDSPPSRSASPSRREAILLDPSALGDPHTTSRRSSSSSSSSSTSTLDLLSADSSAISTPTLVSRPDSPSSTLHQPAEAEPGGGRWDLINAKLTSGSGDVRSEKALSEDDWEALEESVDWGKAPSRAAVGGGGRVTTI